MLDILLLGLGGRVRVEGGHCMEETPCVSSQLVLVQRTVSAQRRVAEVPGGADTAIAAAVTPTAGLRSVLGRIVGNIFLQQTD